MMFWLTWNICYFNPFMTYVTYKIVSERRGNADDSIFMFFTVEGMSDIVYLAFVPIYFIACIFGIGGLAIGAAVAFKYATMYEAYPSLLGKDITSLDRAVCIISSLGSMVLLRGIVFVVFGI